MENNLQTWFEINHDIVFFIYGLVFFTAGLAIVLQSRRHSRLQLAQSLPWLAAFCLIHSLNEWGDMFIPIQSQYTPSLFVSFMRVFQLIVLGSSFACLLRFGIGLLRPLTHYWRWLRWLPMLVFLLWLMGPFWMGLVSSLPLEVWLDTANVTSRYSMGFTGAAISSAGLFIYGEQSPSLSNRTIIRRHLHLAALALALYAIFGGLIGPSAPFFPANQLNADVFSKVFIIPIFVFRSLAGLLLALSMVRVVEIFEVETDQLITRMEIAQIITSEQERIGRDLHDGALQQVYAAGLQAQLMRKHARGQQAADLDALISSLNAAIIELRAFLSAVKPTATNADLKNALLSVIEETSRASEINIVFTPQKEIYLPPDKVTHLTALVREALSNVLRHANAKRVEINYQVENGNLHLRVSDNGIGLPRIIDTGYGLRNMRERARLLGGEMRLSSCQGIGTCINLEIPLE